MGAFTAALGTLCDPAMKKDIQAFFATHSAGTGSRALKQALERVDRCVVFRSVQQESFNKKIAAAP